MLYLLCQAEFVVRAKMDTLAALDLAVVPQSPQRRNNPTPDKKTLCDIIASNLSSNIVEDFNETSMRELPQQEFKNLCHEVRCTIAALLNKTAEVTVSGKSPHEV
jgi:hypothetical protein